MKFLDKKIYIILLLLFILLFESKVFARDSKIQYTSKDISNYFLGVVSASENLILNLLGLLFYSKNLTKQLTFQKKYGHKMNYFMKLISY